MENLKMLAKQSKTRVTTRLLKSVAMYGFALPLVCGAFTHLWIIATSPPIEAPYTQYVTTLSDALFGASSLTAMALGLVILGSWWFFCNWAFDNSRHEEKPRKGAALDERLAVEQRNLIKVGRGSDAEKVFASGAVFALFGLMFSVFLVMIDLAPGRLIANVMGL